MSDTTKQGYFKARGTNIPIAPKTLSTLVNDVARNQALSASLLNLVEKNVLGFPTFVTTKAYAVNEEVFYDRRLYKFTSAHAAGAWNAEDVEEFSIKDYLDAITVALEAKANTDGYYKNLVSGLSENLIDTKGQGSEQTFFKRTSCGNENITDDGAAMVQKFLGNSVKFNQLIKFRNLTTGTGMTFTPLHNGGSVVINGTTTGALHQGISEHIDIIAGHKYCFVTSVEYTIGIFDTDNNLNFSRNTIFTASTSKWIVIQTMVGSVRTFDNLQVDAYLLDLTAMGIDSFTTAAQVKAWLAANVGLKPYYGYTDGIVLNNKALGVRTIGFNRYNPSTGKAELVNYTTNGTNQYQITGTYTSVSFTDILGNTSVPVIDSNGYFSISQDGVLDVVGGNATDTCVHLCWSGYRDGEWEEYWEQSRTKDLTTVTGKKDGTGESVVIFPDGLCKVGDVSDEIQGNKAIKRIGRKVFTEDDNWSYRKGTGAYFFSIAISNMKQPASNSERLSGTILSRNYLVDTGVEISSNAVDKRYKRYLNQIYIRDDSYETSSTFKTSMVGVELYFELATPEVYVLDEDFNTSYKVADFGTEEMIPQELDENDLPQSAAFHAIIKYNDDFTRTIANLPKYVQPLLEAIAYLNGEVQGLKDSIKDYAMNMKANIMDVMEYYVYNVPKVLLSSATGAPSASNVPTNWDAQRSGTWDAVPRTEGLVYIDGTGDVWVSNGTASTENWKKVS